MSGEDHLGLFRTAASQWLCDPYSLEIRYVARKVNESTGSILSCYVAFYPIAWPKSEMERVSTSQMIAGRERLSNVSLSELRKILEELEGGKLSLENLELTLESKSSLSYFTEMVSNDRWFCDAHLVTLGDALDSFTTVEIAKINSELRLNQLPFDGTHDLFDYFRLQDCISAYKQPQIEIRISPPIDLISNQCHTSNGKFNLTLNAHPSLEIKNVSLAIRTFTAANQSLPLRKQVAENINWLQENDRQIGTLEVNVENAFTSQAILMLGTNTVRREFFEDIAKVPNRRLFTLSFFDKELKRLKLALYGSDSDQFEKAVNSLAYLLGFSGCLMNETNAPDIILSSPNENLVIIECTTKISDFSSKLGKLVDRKNSLIKELIDLGDPRKVYSYLVCGLPKDQITINERELATHKVTLITQESINELFEKLKFPQNLEQLLVEDEANLEKYLLQENNSQASLI